MNKQLMFFVAIESMKNKWIIDGYNKTVSPNIHCREFVKIPIIGSYCVENKIICSSVLCYKSSHNNIRTFDFIKNSAILHLSLVIKK